MFKVSVDDYLLMYILCSLVSILTLIYTYGNAINERGEW